MGLIFGIVKGIINFFLYTAIVVAIVLLIPNLPPYTKFTTIELDLTQARTGPLALNEDLNNVEKLYADKLLGPEAFQIWNGELYTGLATGEIIKISHGGHVTFVSQIGQPCITIVHEHICGRPLGFVIDDKNRQLYVADAYYGIWRIDLKSYKKQLLVSPRVAIEGRKPMLFNSVALAANGDLYWTDSSTDYQLKDGVYAIISDPSGRLFRYNPAKNESIVLVDNIWFANGVTISPDNQFVLVVETNRMRVLKHYIDGPKKGSSEIFVTGLPGTPDNIRVLPDGSGVLVSLYAAFDDDNPLLLKSLAATPLARKFAARLMRIFEIPFEFLNSHFPHIIFEQILYTVGHFASVSGLAPGLSGVVQVDWNGNVVSSHYNTDGSVAHISDSIVFNDKLYLGSPHMQNFIGAVPVPPSLKKAFNLPKSTPTPAKDKSDSEKKPPPKDKKPVVEQTKQKVEKTVAQKPSQKPAEKPQTESPKVAPQKQPEVKPSSVPKEPSSKPLKQESTKPVENVKETKPIIETSKPSTEKAPTPSTKPNKETVPEKKSDPEQKPKTAPKIEKIKETVSEPKIVTKSKPTATPSPPKEEPKKDASAQIVKKKSEKAGGTDPTTEKPSSKPEVFKSSTPKPVKAKQEKKAKKLPVDGEPQIIVQKVVPDEIPVEEEILSDTVKPKGEPLKVIKKSGPIEIPAP